MKAFKIVMKILAALALVAGIVFVIAKYGEKIVAWAKQLWSRCCAFFGWDCPCCCDCDCDCEEGDCEGECECDCDCGCAVEEVAEEAPEAPVVAEEGDFEG